MKYIFAICAFLLVSCDGTVTKKTAVVTGAEVVKVDEPVPVSETRSVVKTTPAAEYSEPLKDELNDWKFYVGLYETKRTFHYTVHIQCKELRLTDSVNIPNFGREPIVAVRKGKEPLSALIGFLDKKNNFMEYKEVSFKNDRLRVRTLHTYSVNAYRTKVGE